MEGIRISSPTLFDTVFADAQKYLDQLFDFAGEQAKKPLWQRTPIDLERDQSQPARVAKALFPLGMLIEDGYAPLLAQVRLLACHGAVRQFHWEEDKLPPNLEALNLGDAAIDPYTGELFPYGPSGRKYRLVSAGPVAAPGDRNAVGGRMPIPVVPGE
jgi:hypothetical protein